MATYRLAARPVSRVSGRSSVAAAAYRSGARLYDERVGKLHDYRRRAGVRESFLVVPDGAPAWDRQQLWAAVEAAEARTDARTAIDFQLSLPAELDEAARRALAERFAVHLADTYGLASDVALHEADAEGDQRNEHAHVLATTRQLTVEGFGLKQRALTEPATIVALRERWAELVNAALAEAGSEARVDHRSNAVRAAELLGAADEIEAEAAVEEDAAAKIERGLALTPGGRRSRAERAEARRERGRDRRQRAERTRVEAQAVPAPQGSRGPARTERMRELAHQLTLIEGRAEAEVEAEAAKDRKTLAAQEARVAADRAKAWSAAQAGEAVPSAATVWEGRRGDEEASKAREIDAMWAGADTAARTQAEAAEAEVGAATAGEVVGWLAQLDEVREHRAERRRQEAEQRRQEADRERQRVERAEAARRARAKVLSGAVRVVVAPVRVAHQGGAAVLGGVAAGMAIVRAAVAGAVAEARERRRQAARRHPGWPVELAGSELDRLVQAEKHFERQKEKGFPEGQWSERRDLLEARMAFRSTLKKARRHLEDFDAPTASLDQLRAMKGRLETAVGWTRQGDNRARWAKVLSGLEVAAYQGRVERWIKHHEPQPEVERLTKEQAFERVVQQEREELARFEVRMRATERKALAEKLAWQEAAEQQAEEELRLRPQGRPQRPLEASPAPEPPVRSDPAPRAAPEPAAPPSKPASAPSPQPRSSGPSSGP